MVRQGNSGTNSPQRNARKPASPVIRRRRLFAAAALLLVIAVAVGGFVAVSTAVYGEPATDGGGSASGSQPAVPSDAASPPGTSPAPAAPGTPTPSGCEQNLVTVTSATDKAVYAADENPMLSLKVTNGNKVPCEVNMGTSQMEFLIISGSDRIFSSRDCQADSTDLMRTIGPGQTETANFPWQRNRTVQGCAPIKAKPGTGGAYYVFTARLANKTGPKAVFQLN